MVKKKGRGTPRPILFNVCRCRLVIARFNLQAGTQDDKEFERRAKIADLMLKEKSIKLKEQDMAQNAEIVKMQMTAKGAKAQ